MDIESFRSDGHRLIDWIAEYLAHPERYPVLPQVEPGQVWRALPKEPPEKPEPFEAVLQDLEKIIVPGLTHWNHPGFFAYFAITGSEAGILGELLSATFNVNAMLWRTAPAATELEELVLGWLRQLVGLPPEFMGIINDTASVSSLCAIAAAREALGLRIREEGLAGRPDLPRIRLYTSEQAHSSIEKAAIVLGLGQAGVKKIAVDEEFRLRSQDLEPAIKEDLEAGWKPFCVVATVGTTSTTSVDPVPEIADICERYKLWLHVDAAYAGAAAILPEKRLALAGCERADSFVVNPHKWLFVPIQRLRAHIALAERFQGWIEGSPDFELLAPVPFSVVCFRSHPHGLPASPETEAYLNQLNQRLLDSVNKTGDVFLSHTELNGRFTLRLAIGNLRTTESHVRRAWELLQEHATRLDAELRPAAPGA
jgi:aromatic-L-amino-acid decarboxylase